MNFGSKRLNETQTKEIVIGFGYLMRDVELGFLRGKRSRNRKKKEEEEQPNDPGRGQSAGRNNQLRGGIWTSTSTFRCGMMLPLPIFSTRESSNLREGITHWRFHLQQNTNLMTGFHCVCFSIIAGMCRKLLPVFHEPTLRVALLSGFL